jgi:hypothetical protein
VSERGRASPLDEIGGTGQAALGPTYGMRPVRLVATPARLLKASEDHFDDLFRELQMARLGATHGAGEPGPALPARTGGGDHRAVVHNLALLAERVRSQLAHLREPARRAIWEASSRDDQVLDLEVLADARTPEVLGEVERLLIAASVAARSGFLLTEPPEPEVVAWRRWLRQEMIDQIGGQPPRACPFPPTA